MTRLGSRYSTLLLRAVYCAPDSCGYHYSSRMLQACLYVPVVKPIIGNVRLDDRDVYTQVDAHHTQSAIRMKIRVEVAFTC